ncbi:MAG: DUF5805 domain-containing protein, partial [Haloarculaceae archaeon]
TARTTVRTYVPEYQRDEWDDHAEQLDMSRSEFVRTMVQAGRSGFEPADADTEITPASSDGEEGRSPDATPRGQALEDRVEAILSEDDFHSWEELVTELTDDIEQRLEDALQSLQSENRVRYSGRNGGYTLDR